MPTTRLALTLILSAFGPAVQDNSATPEQGALYRLALLAQRQAQTLDTLTRTVDQLNTRLLDLENDVNRLRKG